MNYTDVDVAELVRLFRSFCGVDTYRKFLCTTNTCAVHKRRLLYWQEQLWDDFCTHHPDYLHLASDNLLDVFRICHIHEQRLLDDQVPAVYSHWRFPEDYLTAMSESFPFANMLYCGDSVERQRHANRNVKYCPACREALVRWNAQRKHRIGLP